MNERIREFLSAENKSSAQFAEEIGVQPSGISHILSGRNKPSLDFVIKMLEKYKYLSTEWLLFGNGPMYRDSGIRTLFSDESTDINKNKTFEPSLVLSDSREAKTDTASELVNDKIGVNSVKSDKNVKKIVWFYDDGSFVEYFPE